MPRDALPFCCSRSTRDPDGYAVAATLRRYDRRDQHNIGIHETTGWDMTSTTSLSMSDWGTLNFTLIGTCLDSFESTEPVAGRRQVRLRRPLRPDLRHAAAGVEEQVPDDMVTPWNLDLSLTWRYFDRSSWTRQQ